jgi:hypothetical protein
MADEKQLLNLNEDNLPVFGDPNGAHDLGDAAHNVFTLLYCGWTSLEPLKALEMLTDTNNWPLRSNQPYWWHGRPGRCSRDLLTPYLCYVAAHNPAYFTRLKSALKKHAYLLADNSVPNFRYPTREEHALKSTPDVPYEPQHKLPDFLGPDIWAIVLRGTCKQSTFKVLIYPVLCFLDLHLLGAALLQHYRQETDLRNLALKMHFSSTYLPTIVSKLAMYIFKRSNPLRAFATHWQKPGEPRVDLYMSKLFA